jgi:hypothetical protein
VTRVAGHELEELFALRELTRDQVQERFGIDESGVDPDVAYERLGGVDALYEPSAFPGHFFFRGDELVMIYIPRTALADTDLEELRRALGEPAATLSSRTGEDSSLLVYPDRGVAFATDGEKVEIVEVFPPTTLDDYRTRIYKEPPERIR